MVLYVLVFRRGRVGACAMRGSDLSFPGRLRGTQETPVKSLISKIIGRKYKLTLISHQYLNI